jgi:Domain of unknown function (DUF6458)
MRTGVGLAVICVGAILAFAVTTNTSVFNLHTAGWVLMIIGVIGLCVPARTYGWLGRRLVRRTRTYRGGRVEEVAVRPYMTYDPGNARVRPSLPRPTLMTEEPVGADETEVIEDVYEP